MPTYEHAPTAVNTYRPPTSEGSFPGLLYEENARRAPEGLYDPSRYDEVLKSMPEQRAAAESRLGGQVIKRIMSPNVLTPLAERAVDEQLPDTFQESKTWNGLDVSLEKKWGTKDPVLAHVAEQFEEEGSHVAVFERDRDDKLMNGFDSLLIADHTERKDTEDDEPTVRVYRGIKLNRAQMNDGIAATQANKLLHQQSYLSRQSEVENHDDKSRQAVAALNESMTLPHLERAVRTVDSSDEDKRFLNTQVQKVSEELARDPAVTLRELLIEKHYTAVAGADRVGISPFVATTTNPIEAAAYGDTVEVVEVPVSRIGGMIRDVDGSEVLIETEIDPSWIVAVAKVSAEHTEAEASLRMLEEKLAATDSSPEANEQTLAAAVEAKRINDLEQADADRERLKEKEKLALIEKVTSMMGAGYPELLTPALSELPDKQEVLDSLYATISDEFAKLGETPDLYVQLDGSPITERQIKHLAIELQTSRYSPQNVAGTL